MLDEDTSDTGFDLGASLEAVASEMKLNTGRDEPVNDVDLDSDTDTETQVVNKADPTQPTVRAAPKSWAKEHHERWGKLDGDTQGYIELREKQFLDGLEQYKGDAGYAKQMREVTAPFAELLQSQGVEETQAVNYLLSAHRALTTGSPEQRAEMYAQLGRDLGIGQPQQQDPNDPLIDLRKKVESLESDRQATQQRFQQERRQKADLETSTFAADPANAYFNDVAPDMVQLVKSGMSLKDAYETAVYRNPVTRQKEIDRLQTEAAAKSTEKAKTEAEAAKRATSTNVRGARTQAAPTEPKGSMEDTMHDTLKRIRARS
jgi:predicted  nucleic acid-binding Zn-ribbon protein